MAQAKTPEIKAAILQAWQDAQNEGITRTAFHERIKGTDLEITYGGLDRWLKEIKHTSGVDAAKPARSPSGSKSALAFVQEFEAQYAAERDEKLRVFLHGKVKEFEVALAAAQGALREHEQKMGITPPSVDTDA